MVSKVDLCYLNFHISNTTRQALQNGTNITRISSVVSALPMWSKIKKTEPQFWGDPIRPHLTQCDFDMGQPYAKWHVDPPMWPTKQRWSYSGGSMGTLHTLMFGGHTKTKWRCSRWQPSSSSHGVLFLNVAVSTTDRQVSRLVAFFHSDERQILCGFKSASVARSQVDDSLALQIIAKMIMFSRLTCVTHFYRPDGAHSTVSEYWDTMCVTDILTNNSYACGGADVGVASDMYVLCHTRVRRRLHCRDGQCRLWVGHLRQLVDYL